MSKKLVLTLVGGANHRMIGEITQPQMKAYAKRIGAKFAVTQVREDYPHSVPWCKFEALHHWFDQFDRIIFLDNDALINAETCPDLFELVPETHIGAYCEGFVAPERLGAMYIELDRHKLEIDKEKPPEASNYFNSGVMVVSRQHQDLFSWPDEIVDNFYEQSLLNARAYAFKIPIFSLEYKFNRMSIQDPWTGEERHAAHIIHFAGSNDFPRIAEGMKEDLDRWKNKTPAQMRIYVEAAGGIGDVIEAEPVMRYAIEEVYENDPNVLWRIVTAYPRVLSHFRRYPNVKVTYRVAEMDEGKPFCAMTTHPPNDSQTRTYFPYHAVHNHDFAAYAMLRNVLPVEKKQIELEVKEEDWEELKKAGFETTAFGGRPVRPPLAIHAGTGWNSKTFPKDWWQRIINKLARDYTVVLFGDHRSLPVDCPENGVDTRGKLSLGGMFGLIKTCPILLTNDSSPVHAAGAFDNWIVMIATCKRPELVFPFRKGRVDHRTIAVQNKLTCNPYPKYKPTYPHPMVIAEIIGESQNIADYLPSVDEVVDAVRSCRV